MKSTLLAESTFIFYDQRTRLGGTESFRREGRVLAKSTFIFYGQRRPEGARR